MQASIDISLMTLTSAVGRVSGELEFAELPRAGELVSFQRVAVPAAKFSGQVAVSKVIHVAAESQTPPLLLLADVTLPTEADAQAVGQSLERCYGLAFEPYENAPTATST